MVCSVSSVQTVVPSDQSVPQFGLHLYGLFLYGLFLYGLRLRLRRWLYGLRLYGLRLRLYGLIGRLRAPVGFSA